LNYVISLHAITLLPGSANIPINLILPEDRIMTLAYIFVADSRGLSSFKFVQWTPKTHLSATECVLAVQVHSRSPKTNDFGNNRKRVCDFLLVPIGPILHRFRGTATYWLKIAYFSYPSLIRHPPSLSSLWNFALKLTTRKL